jgi:growth factor-regulated tyrosine kinase substrate
MFDDSLNIHRAKKASAEVRKKLLDTKETVILNALSVIEAIVKNTPGPIHQDFLSSDLLGSMKAIVVGQNTSMSRAIDKVLEVLGEWKAAFGEDNAYKGIITTFNELEKEGYYIPEANLASASFMKKPPEFEESNNCYLCSKEFGGRVYKGRHHCRNCGKSICSSCLHDNRLSLPHFGIDVPQKICISCSKKLDKTSESSGATPSANNETQRGTSPNPPPTGGNQKELELQEQEDIEMAIAISLNEQENKKKSSYSSPMSQSMVPTTTVPSAPPSKYTPIYADLDFVSCLLVCLFN